MGKSERVKYDKRGKRDDGDGGVRPPFIYHCT